MEKADAIRIAEEWLRAVDAGLDQPDGVRVDHDNVKRGVEGWEVPWDTIAFLDGGDEYKRIFPFQILIVTEPDGVLRQANTTPHPGFSTLAQWPGKPEYREIIDPEYRQAALYEQGVPNHVVLAWEIKHPDGTTEEKLNPGYEPGPFRVGLPRPYTRLEALINYHQLGRIGRDGFLLGLLHSEVLLPLDWETGDVDSQCVRGSSMQVYTSPRWIPHSIKWLRISVPTFVARYPGNALIINDQEYPKANVSARELADTSAKYPFFQTAEPVVVTEPGPDGALDQRAQQIQQEFGLPQPPSVFASWIVAARDSGHNLTADERDKTLLGVAWRMRNTAVTTYAGRTNALLCGEDDISLQQWPADLHANGLVARHDSAGRLRPELNTFGKYLERGGSDIHRSWRAALGAYAGFALGDALGSAVDGLSLQEIRQRFNGGLRGFEVAFDRPGQVSWRTQLLLFLTEGTVRGATNSGDNDPNDLPPAIVSAHARWLVTQGMTWQQAAGPLAAQHPGPDGWLVNVPELHAQRGVPPLVLDTIPKLLPDPSKDLGLHGPMMVAAALPGANGGTAPYRGWHRPVVDQAAEIVLYELFRGLLMRKDFVNPVWMQLEELAQTGIKAPAYLEADEISSTVRHVASRARDYRADDTAEIEQIGDGTDTRSVLGRALLVAARRESDPRRALLTAVNQSGRSAMTGALVGALVGARAGVVGLPQDWLAALDLADVVQEVANDAFWHFARRNPLTEDDGDKVEWDKRYPRW